MLHAGIMLASFVGVVATSLAFASVGLVAVSGSVATGAAAGDSLLLDQQLYLVMAILAHDAFLVH